MAKLNCYDAMVFSAGSILLPLCDLHYYFLDAFSTRYYKGGISKSTHENIVNTEGYFIKNNILKKYYGLYITKEIISNKDLVEKKIESSILQLKPIGVQMDSFYLPWNNLYFKMHRTHCFLITEITNKSYVCLDTFLTNEKVYIDKQTLIDNIEWLFYFDIDLKSKKKSNLKDLVLFLQDYISMEQKEHIKRIEEFADDILKYCTMQYINHENIEQSNFIYSIANVEWSRNNFSNALKLAKTDFNTLLFDNIIILMDQIYVLWGTVKSLIIKGVFNSNYYKKASQLVQTIAVKENEIIELILNIYI